MQFTKIISLLVLAAVGTNALAGAGAPGKRMTMRRREIMDARAARVAAEAVAVPEVVV